MIKHKITIEDKELNFLLSFIELHGLKSYKLGKSIKDRLKPIYDNLNDQYMKGGNKRKWQ